MREKYSIKGVFIILRKQTIQYLLLYKDIGCILVRCFKCSFTSFLVSTTLYWVELQIFFLPPFSCIQFFSLYIFSFLVLAESEDEDKSS